MPPPSLRAAFAAGWGRRLVLLGASGRSAALTVSSSHYSGLSMGSKRPRPVSPTHFLGQQQRQHMGTDAGGGEKGYDSVDGYAKIDYAREARTGLPEVCMYSILEGGG